MESVLNLIFSAENVRMLVMLVFGFSCFIWLKTSFERRIGGVELSLGKRIDDVELSLGKRIDGVELSLNKRIDGVELSLGKRIDDVDKRIDDLKHNDFAHLCSTIEALTFTLEKNGYLKHEDKEYIDSRLD
jgi:hypothetical protein